MGGMGGMGGMDGMGGMGGGMGGYGGGAAQPPVRRQITCLYFCFPCLFSLLLTIGDNHQMYIVVTTIRTGACT